MRWKITANLLQSVIASCDRDLRQLSIIYKRLLVTVTEAEILALTQSYPNLRCFQFESFYVLIKEKTIETLLKNLPQLEVFILMGLLSNSERHIDVETYRGLVFRHMNTGIKVIQTPGYLFDEAGIQCLGAKRANQLRDLKLFDLIDLKWMGGIADHFPALRSLYCSTFTPDITPTHVYQYFSDISRLERLEKLHLLIDSDVPIVGFYDIRFLKACPHMRTVRIESTALTTDCVEGIAKFLPALKKLELTYVRFYTDDLTACLAPIGRMQRLTHLKLSSEPELSDQLLIKVVKGCAQLKHIDVSRCEDITTESIVAFVELAIQRPNMRFECLFNSCIKKDFKQFGREVPHNLSVNFLHIRKLY